MAAAAARVAPALEVRDPRPLHGAGADIFKALALGANAVGIGRAQAWSLASFGTEGVETVIELLRRELQVAMVQTGATSISRISKSMLIPVSGSVSSRMQ